MKFLFIFITFFTTSLLANDIIELYRKGGLKEVENYIEEKLKSEEYWLGKVQSIDTDYGYYEDLEYFLLCNKYLRDFRVYRVNDDKFKFINNSKAYVGMMGDKEKEGDLKTPVGVYDLTKKLIEVDDFYGPLAFVTSYPNTYDKIRDKNGHGIWIHGLPLDDSKREENTKGCIALDNEYLSDLDKEINFEKSLLVIGEDGLQKVEKEDLAIVLSSLFKWREAWRESDIETYLSFYDKKFKRFDKMNLDEFKKYKRRIFSRKEKKSIEFTNINIAPYPNLYNEKMFRVTFDEDYKTKNYQFKGNKELYIKVKNKNISIILEK